MVNRTIDVAHAAQRALHLGSHVTRKVRRRVEHDAVIYTACRRFGIRFVQRQAGVAVQRSDVIELVIVDGEKVALVDDVSPYRPRSGHRRAAIDHGDRAGAVCSQCARYIWHVDAPFVSNKIICPRQDNLLRLLVSLLPLVL